MRIGVSTPFCWPEVRRGGERYAHELAAALAQRGHDVTVWSTAIAPGKDRVLGVETIRLRQRKLRPARFKDQAVEVGFAAELLSRLALTKLDVWHANGIADGAAATMLASLRPGLTTVFTDHGFPVAASKAKRSDAGLHRRIVKSIDSYVCVSEAAGTYLRSDFNREPTVITPGVDVASYASATRADVPTIVFSGRLDEPRKNLAQLLEAAAIVIDDHPDLQLWLLGQGDATSFVEAADPRVRAAITTCREVEEQELRRRYAKAWVTVLPSVAESFGLVIVESWASGTPVVVRSDSGGPAGLVTDDRTGVVSGPETIDLARSISQALTLASDPKTTEACQQAAQPHDWSHVAAKLERVYAG